MGDSFDVHMNFYILPTAASELAKISRLLLASEEGDAHKFAGQNLIKLSLEESKVSSFLQDRSENKENIDPVKDTTIGCDADNEKESQNTLIGSSTEKEPQQRLVSSPKKWFNWDKEEK